MTALDIQISLWNDLRTSRDLVMPNYTPVNWFECDLMSVTKAGYLEEHEIKLSVSDFNADRQKNSYERWKMDAGELVKYGGLNKHQALASGYEYGPSRFWFVIAAKLENKVVIPDCAGLKVARISNYNSRVFLEEMKKAPKLHSHKVDNKVVEHAKSVCYWRYWNTKTDVQKSVNRELKRIKEHE
jgi:hypothetical protein